MRNVRPDEGTDLSNRRGLSSEGGISDLRGSLGNLLGVELVGVKGAVGEGVARESDGRIASSALLNAGRGSKRTGGASQHGHSEERLELHLEYEVIERL